MPRCFRATKPRRPGVRLEFDGVGMHGYAVHSHAVRDNAAEWQIDWRWSCRAGDDAATGEVVTGGAFRGVAGGGEGAEGGRRQRGTHGRARCLPRALTRSAVPLPSVAISRCAIRHSPAGPSSPTPHAALCIRAANNVGLQRASAQEARYACAPSAHRTATARDLRRRAWCTPVGAPR